MKIFNNVYNDKNILIKQEIDGELIFLEEYDEKNRLIKKENDRMIELYKYENKNFDNLITEKDRVLKHREKETNFKYEYNELGKEIKIFKDNCLYKTKEYDDFENLILDNLILDYRTEKIHYKYDEKNRILEKKLKEDELFLEITSYSYKEENDILIVNKTHSTLDTDSYEYDNSYEIIHYNKNNILIYSKSEENEMFYNDEGYILKRINQINNFEINYEYDLFNNKTKEIRLWNQYDNTKNINEYKYDGNYNLIEVINNNIIIDKYINNYEINKNDLDDFFNFDNKTLDLTNI